MDDLTGLKQGFIQQICTACIDEGPFSFNYTFRSILLSKQIVSLFGECHVMDRLPHGWNYYEGETFYISGKGCQKITLNDLFATSVQKEWLRQICEKSLKSESISYFGGKEPLCSILDQERIRTFVVDDKNLMIIFQPYTVGGGADGPFVVKIPFAELYGKWQPGNLVERCLPIDTDFIASWDEDNWTCNIQEGSSIGSRESFSN